jgi:arsenite methyltransferase
MSALLIKPGSVLRDPHEAEATASLKSALGPPLPRHGAAESGSAGDDSLFEHFSWLYILCRENLFRDDTQRIVAALWPNQQPGSATSLIEVGCGPGFYSCRLAKRFANLSVLGVDSSNKQLHRARRKARALGLKNCSFARRDALAMSSADESFDYLVASRLFTVVPKRRRAMAEMFRVLQPGGRCFIAEPRYSLWASLPLLAMWLLASVTRYQNVYREPRHATVMDHNEFHRLLDSQPWKKVRIWRDGRYQYALCEKG